MHDISLTLPKNTQILVAREMTKIHESFYRGTIIEVMQEMNSSSYGSKGEFVLVVSAFENPSNTDFSHEEQRIFGYSLRFIASKGSFITCFKDIKQEEKFSISEKDR